MSNSYYRRITETLPQGFKKFIKTLEKQVRPGLRKENLRYHLTHFSIMFMIILFIFLVYYAILSYIQLVATQEDHGRAISSLSYWEEIVEKHPNFPDGYYNAALYAAMLGEREKATELLERALVLDPTFNDAKKLEEEINEE